VSGDILGLSGRDREGEEGTMFRILGQSGRIEAGPLDPKDLQNCVQTYWKEEWGQKDILLL